MSQKLHTSDDPSSPPVDAGSNVLVLDDEPTIRDVVCRFLAQHGYQSLEASSVSEAAAVLKQAPVVAILLDVRLSGHASGLDLLTQLRGQPALASTPAIVMTGGVLTDAEKGLVERNGALLFYKPDGLSALIGFLQQITTNRPAH